MNDRQYYETTFNGITLQSSVIKLGEHMYQLNVNSLDQAGMPHSYFRKNYPSEQTAMDGMKKLFGDDWKVI